MEDLRARSEDGPREKEVELGEYPNCVDGSRVL